MVFGLVAASEADWKLLDRTELARAKRLILPQKRDQFVLARANLRRVMGTALACAPEDVSFCFGEYDKPALEVSSATQRTALPVFNLSHSHRVAVLGVVGAPIRLGIDVEHARPGREFLSIAGSFFSASERAVLMGLPKTAVCEAFYRAWTRKEGYLKAIGTGLSFASSRFTIEYRDGEKPAVLATDAPGDQPRVWRMLDLSVAAGYAAAACWDGPDLSVRWWGM